MSGGTLPPGQIAFGAPEPAHPKAPELACDGQNRPPALDMLAVPVVIGFKLTGKAGSTTAAGGLQSWVLPPALTGVQGWPESGDAPPPDVQAGSQVPELVTPGVPPMHSGHGWLEFAVR